MNSRCFFHVPKPFNETLSYEIQENCIYDWFVRGWTVEEIALMTNNGVTFVNYCLERFEQEYKYGESTIPAIQ